MSANTLRKIDSRLQEMDPESLRYQVLVALRRFRSSWVDLGRMLTQVAYGGDYKEWGYEDFEVYCASELGLKKPTVNKLMVSYRYMQSKAPERLAEYEESGHHESPPPDVPDYQTVELLHRAGEKDEIPANDLDRFHRLAFDDGVEQGDLRKEIRSAMSVGSDRELGEEKRREKELSDIGKSCRALRKKIADSQFVPEGLVERFDCLLGEIEALE